MSTLAAALAERPLTLDGGLSTELERAGHDISGQLWSARLLQDDPAAVVQAHAQFLRAGAQVISTASYQATPEGFVRAGFTAAEAEALLQRSVHLARTAQQVAGAADSWVAGSVGPYATLLADGSEYTGDYGPDVDLRRLREFHRPRLEILAAAGVDVLAVETVPSLLEVEALVLELAALGHPAWISLSTVTGADGIVRTRRGEPAGTGFALAGEVAQIIAVGANCTEPGGIGAAVAIAAASSAKPVLVYPNSGESWDARARTWGGSPTSGFDAPDVLGWIDAGAAGVGGCCRVGPDLITEIAAILPVTLN